uniref:non-specific serine/threonine protein kinase n=1 Tax=Albugo laibachii Nc14 TaxID=890382 RepID=F0WBK1_9STRA|nr:phosphoinositide 3kinase regulatory subunit putativ [Albugo laibachii Nc14]|eukprot:CCA18528.1 phosphoinositide 3kinase regulatory subunit putativ [Albugo laibachii Nc14]
MGNAAARSQPASPLDSASQYRTYLMDYSYSNLNIVFNAILADSKFFKTIQCKCDDGMMVVIKLYRQYDLQETLTSVHMNLRLLSSVLSPLEAVPNLIPYADYQFSTKHHVAFLVRQYFAMNLYDRVLSRPFLSTIEKKWITFQLLKALEQCHRKGVCHGDVKLENLMIVTWNWLFLTDFAPFKPTYIPEDDPSEYHYYFCAIDGSGRSCSVAPERFYSPNAEGFVGNRRVEEREMKEAANNRDVSLAVRSPGSAAGATHITSPSEASSTTGFTYQNSRASKEGMLLESMDIFSAGCAIAELFMGGKPLFDLPALLKYRRTGDTSGLIATLKKIQDPILEKLLLDMLQLDPNARKSASQYLTDNLNRLFPTYFESFLFRFLALVLSCGGRIPDARIRLVCKYYGRLVKEIAGVDDVEGVKFFKQRLKEGFGADRHITLTDLPSTASSRKAAFDHESFEQLPLHVAQRVLEELDRRTQKARSSSGSNFDTTESVNLSSAVKGGNTAREREAGIKLHGNEQKKKIEKLHDQYNNIVAKKQQWAEADLVPAKLKEEQKPLEESDARPPKPQVKSNGKRGSSPSNSSPLDCNRSDLNAISSMKLRAWGPEKNGAMIILSLVCSSLRHVQVPESKRTAIYLIHSLGRFTSDDVRLQRLVPFLLEVLKDSVASIRALAIRTVTFILDMVTSVPLSDASVFPQFILDAMNPFPFDPDESVRIAFAECLPQLASTARRFLELTHAIKPKSFTALSSFPAQHSQEYIWKSHTPLQLTSNTFDKELNRLHKMISRFVVQLAAYDQKTSSSLVKRALLLDISRLCLFFGRERTLDVILPQLIAFLNDQEWQVRAAFFQAVPKIALLLGKQTVELYILPCIEQALIDVQELVITNAVHCLNALITLGLFQSTSPETVRKQTHAIRNWLPLDSILEKLALVLPLVLHPSWWIRDAVFKLLADIVIQIGYVDANVFLLLLLRPFLLESVTLMPKQTQIGENDEKKRIAKALRNATRPFVPRATFDAALIASSVSMEANAMEEAESATLAEEQQKEETANGLHLMQQYIRIASTHMRSKMELAHLEQVARIQAPLSSLSPANAPQTVLSVLRGIPQTLSMHPTTKLNAPLYAIQVPDIRFALMLTQPLKLGNLIVASGNAPTPTPTPTPTASTSSPIASLSLENLSLGLIIKMYGLQFPVVSMRDMENREIVEEASAFANDTYARDWHDVSFSAPSAHLSESRAAYHSIESVPPISTPISGRNVLRFMGNTGMNTISTLPQTSTMGNGTIDPAIQVPRKLLARLTALGIPPLPCDFGALRLSDGTMFSIYAHPNSPYNIHPHSIMLGNAHMNNVGNSISAVQSIASEFSSGNSFEANGTHKFSSPMLMLSGPLGMVPSSSASALSNLPSPSVSFTSHSVATYGASRMGWRPQKNLLVAELAEHSGAVTRIAAAKDFSFLASASQDGTVKLWSIRSMQHSINQRSQCTYDVHGGVLTDMLVMDNSHSVVCASTNGIVSLFRVDKGGNSTMPSPSKSFQATELKQVRVHNQAIVVLDHFDTISESLIVYATRDGAIYAWDLRMRRLAWTLFVWPELGYITAITHPMDVMWLVVGTSRGFLCVWDLRFLILIRIWRHSSQRMIHRLKPCLGLSNTARLEECAVPLVFVAAADGDVGVFDLSMGACRAVFRNLHAQATDAEACQCPLLVHIPIPHRNRQFLGSLLGISGIIAAFEDIATPIMSEEHSVRAILCPGNHLRNVGDAMITGGEDRQIRYWDLRNGKHAFTVSGESQSTCFYDNQAAPSDWWRASNTFGNQRKEEMHVRNEEYEGEDAVGPLPESIGSITKAQMAWSKLNPPLITICQDSSYFSCAQPNGIATAVAMERRGLIPPSTAHTDCILDLTLIDLNGPMLVSSARDGLIKVWK